MVSNEEEKCLKAEKRKEKICVRELKSAKKRDMKTEEKNLRHTFM